MAAIHIPEIFETKSRFDVQHVAASRDSARRTHVEESRQLSERAERYDDDDPYMDVLVDERSTLDEVASLAQELSIVALYRVVELNTIVILRWRWPNAESAGYYRVNKLKQKVKSELKTSLASIDGFSVVDELRSVNNAVKHERRVTKELSEFDGWTKGEPLTGLGRLFDRAAEVVPAYLRGLAEIVVPSGRTSLRA